MKFMQLPFFSLACLLLFGCQAMPNKTASPAFTENMPRSILVLPPLNNSVEIDAPYIYLSTISKPLAEKGYYVYPVSVVDYFLKDNGLPTPAEMHTIPLEKISEHIGADSVLYVTIEQWGQKFQVLSSKTVVSAKLKLVHTKTGQTLWESHAFANHVPNNNNSGGLFGALVGAIATQIVGSLADQTPTLSSQANHYAVKNRGLPDGPYRSNEPGK